MKRAVGRAYQRVKGVHPRRPKSRTSLLLDIACDLLLASSAAGLVGGMGVLLWATVGGLETARLVSGAALIAIGAALLLAWERIAWEPFAQAPPPHLDDLK